MTLGQTQEVFAEMLGNLIIYANSLGYDLRIGEVWRNPVLRDEYVRRGLSHPSSTHFSKLAVDINLFWGGEYLARTEDHRVLGEYWEKMGESYGVPAVWGGRFSDGNHYSIKWNGVM